MADDWAANPAMDDPDLIDQLVLVSLMDRRPDAALAAALRGHELAPTAGSHLISAAVAAIRLGRPEWAVAFATRAAESEIEPAVGAPHEAIRLATLAHAWALVGDRSRAVALLRQAIMVDPENPEWHTQLGIVLDCQDKKAEALPEIRRGLRTNDEPDPIENPWASAPEEKWTRLSAYDVYDMSEGTSGALTLPSIPATWEQLIAGSRREGDGYFAAVDAKLRTREDALRDATGGAAWSALYDELDQVSPATRDDAFEILDRLSPYSGEPDLWEASRSLDDASKGLPTTGTGWLDFCVQAFPEHEHCPILERNHTDDTCALDHRVFDAVRETYLTYADALTNYHRVAWPYYTALQANLSNPNAHHYAGMLIELEFVQRMQVLSGVLAADAEHFSQYNRWNPEKDNPEQPCVGASPIPSPVEPDLGGTVPALCAEGSLESRIEITIDLKVAEFTASCEKFTLELSTAPVYGFLQGFARIEHEWFGSGTSYHLGVRASAPGVGGIEAAFVIETDSDHKVTDVLLDGDAELDLNILDLTLDEDSLSFIPVPTFE
jgi:hypothetical protein